MTETFQITNNPDADELWKGIGGHFDSLEQIINEFLDNAISNFIGNNVPLRNIILSLEELSNGKVEVKIEDSGTGMKDVDRAFTLGSTAAGESPLNEHGFGLKHAMASANPDNNDWEIYTRTQEHYENGYFLKITSAYKINDFKGEKCPSLEWPGQFMTGTIVRFICEREMYQTIARGIRGGMSNFRSIADVLFEDIGFVYAGIIKANQASIVLKIKDCNGVTITKPIGAVEPDWEDFIKPGQGSEKYDLGGGELTIEYSFGRIAEKGMREEFDNSTTRKYYRRNMSSSGVEIRINGRVLCYNLFQEIWGIEKHNSYNYLLVVVNLRSQDSKTLPKTRTSKNGLREGDPKLDALYGWIRTYLSSPVKDVSLSDHETDLFEELKNRKLQYNPDPNKLIDTEKTVFNSTGNKKDLVRIDLYERTMGKTKIYEGKKDTTTSKDVYQLRMYWDGLVYDGITPDEGILIANEHPDSVRTLIAIVNEMYDSNNHKYNLTMKTWKEEGIDLGYRNVN